jgi:hypothetical protein
MIDQCADCLSDGSGFIPLMALFRRDEADGSGGEVVARTIENMNKALPGIPIRISPWWTAAELPDGKPNPLSAAMAAVVWLYIEQPTELARSVSALRNTGGVEAIVVGRSFGIQPGDPNRQRDAQHRDGKAASEDQHPDDNPNARGAVVGIIDDGIAFAHRRFRRRARAGQGWIPRIEWFWDQDQAGAHAHHSPGVGFGAEWSGSPTSQLVAGDIATLLQVSTHAGLVDEDEVYRRALHGQAGGRARHGTHVLDLAAGTEPDEEGSAIIAVQLPEAIAANPGDPCVQWNLLEGLAYIVWRAHSIPAQIDGKPRPLVVNLSYGIFDGPHDGTLVLEKAMARVTQAVRKTRPFAIVMAAGNHAQERCRAKINLRGKGSTASMTWNIPPDSDRPAFAEFWTDQAHLLEIALESPGSDIWSTNHAPPQDPSVAARASVTRCQASPDGRSRILLKVMPTFGMTPGAMLAPSGNWTIRLTSQASGDVAVDAWIRRNDTPFGFKGRARQSRFDQRHDARFDDLGRLREEDPPTAVAHPPATVRREGTLNGIATGNGTIVVGAARRLEYRPPNAAPLGPTAYTSHGMVNGKRPDLVARGDHSLAQPGILAAGTRSGSVVCLNGTSVAAPAVTRALATALMVQPDVAQALAGIRVAITNGSYLRTGGFVLNTSSVRPEAMR